jgi:hypothetical protein
VLIGAPLRAAELPLLHSHAGDASVRTPLVIVAVDDAWRAALPRDAKLATQAYLDRLPKEAVQRSNDYDEGGYWLQLWEVLIGLAIAGLLLQGRRSARLRDWAQRVRRPRLAARRALRRRLRPARRPADAALELLPGLLARAWLWHVDAGPGRLVAG